MKSTRLLSFAFMGVGAAYLIATLPPAPATPTPTAAWASPSLSSTGPATVDAPTLREAVQEYLDTLRANGAFPGVSVGLVLETGDTLGAVSGVADRDTGAPLTADSRFMAGSVGKTFFAAFALQLVEQGRLELDTPVDRFLGEEPWFDRLPNARDMTVRMLMNHTSGLRRYEFHPEVAERVTADPDLVWTPEDRLSYLFDTDAPFDAGGGWEYSDTNYIVLGMILEGVAGEEAYAEIERRFTGPLGLRNTVPSDRRCIPGLVQGYAGPENPFGQRDRMVEDERFVFNPQLEWAGGGFASSPQDLAVWAHVLFSGALLGPEVLRELLDGIPTPSPNLSYGLGAMIHRTELGPAYGHGGFFPGYLSEMRYYEELGVAVAVQFNTSVAPAIGQTPGQVVHALAELVADHRDAR